MRYRKKTILFVFLVLIIIIFSFSFCQAETENLIYNPGFEEVDHNGLPAGWFTDAYVQDPGYSLFSVQEDNHSPVGNHYACIQNFALNDARFAQEIEVEPESVYMLTASVLADADETGRGANLSVEGLYVFSESLFHTMGNWESITWYGETGENQHYITLYARLGGYSGESTGKACFDNLCLKKVDHVPGNIIADQWFKETKESFYYSEDDESVSTESAPAFPYLMILSLTWLAVSAMAMLWAYEKDKNNALSSASSVINYYFYPFLLIALILRTLLGCLVEGYAVDVNCFLSWGNTMLHAGPSEFYQSTGFCDYPPAYAYILGLNAWIVSLFSKSSLLPYIEPLAYRLFPIFSDIIACILLREAASRQNISKRITNVFALIMAFNPVTIINSSCWGQMDSVLCLLLMIVAMTAISHRWYIALPCYMLSVLVKPQALMLGFLGLLAIMIEWIKNKAYRKRILLGLGLSLILSLIIILPYSVNQSPLWIFEQYAGTLSEYPYATVNTTNYWYLFNGNWNSIANKASVISAVILCIILTAWGIYLWKKQKFIHYRAFEPVLAWAFAAGFLICSLIHTTWTVLGILTMLYAFVTVLPMYIRAHDLHMLPLLGGILFLLLYTFGIKMHERYLFPAFLLLAYAFLTVKDHRILLVLLFTSISVFLNIGIVLDNSIRLGSAYGHLNADTEVIAKILSCINIFSSVYGCIICHDICNCNHRVAKPVTYNFIHMIPCKKVQTARNPENYHTDHLLHWNRKDSILLFTITIVYAFISFSTLGSTKAPQTAWTSTAYDENIIFDLGNNYEDFTVLYFAQVSRYNFSISTSDNEKDFNSENWAEMDQGQCWKWKYITPYYEAADNTIHFLDANSYENVQHFSGRYVRLTAHQIGLKLNEIIFRNADGQTIPASIVIRSGENPSSPNYSDPECLLDEQDTLEALPNLFGWNNSGTSETPAPDTPQPSWYNSTYFDEIYHARTAYEHLNGTIPYETSHPPLGKVLMSLGIAIFGMTPFGWRFMGALAGVLMLPGIYLLAKQLTKKTLPSVLACLMMALDCMHLTQTQIATIDSFPVLFIIYSWFFMLRFLQSDLRKLSLPELCPSLALCGLMMGLGISSKWIGIYSGAGLALAFFWHCIRHFRLCRLSEPRENFTHKFLSICLCCVVFFCVIPIAIYLLSYIPYFSWQTQIHNFKDFIHEVIKAQIGMFNYHSTPGLGMDHPFYSPWYEWPLMLKPMFYASQAYIPDRNFAYSIFSFGNPAIWLTGLMSIIICIILWIYKKRYKLENSEIRWHIGNPGFDNSLSFILIAFMAQFLPWVLVPRGTYIYHYFASIPFLILGSAFLFSKFQDRKPKAAYISIYVYLCIAVAFFILLWPYASGMIVPVQWLNIGKNLLRIYY